LFQLIRDKDMQKKGRGRAREREREREYLFGGNSKVVRKKRMRLLKGENGEFWKICRR